MTVDNVDSAEKFYSGIYTYDDVTRGVFGGIKYASLMQDGEVAMCFFQKGPDNPLAAEFPVLKVDSVPNYMEKIKASGGKVLIPQNNCPCTGAPFSVCTDPMGNQFMIKQERGSK